MDSNEININKRNFGLLIKKHRKKKGMSQDKLAVLVGITRKSVSCIERGECYPSSENIFKIAKLLDISLDEYLYNYSRFDETINFTEINDLLSGLTEEQISLVLSVIQAMCKALNIQEQIKKNK